VYKMTPSDQTSTSGPSYFLPYMNKINLIESAALNSNWRTVFFPTAENTTFNRTRLVT